MKINLPIFLILLSFLSCSESDQKKTISIMNEDTLLTEKKIVVNKLSKKDKVYYDNLISNHNKEIDGLYEFIRDNEIDNKTLNEIDQLFLVTIISAIVTKNSKINKITMLFFIKLHRLHLEKFNIGYKIFPCNYERYACVSYFTIIYIVVR